jgi:hypothetical protein
MSNSEPNQKREHISNHTYKIGREVSPILVLRLSTKDANKYKKEGWEKVLVSFKQEGETLRISYTGIRTERVKNAAPNSNRETKKTEGINPFIKVIRQAISFFR